MQHFALHRTYHQHKYYYKSRYRTSSSSSSSSKSSSVQYNATSGCVLYFYQKWRFRLDSDTPNGQSAVCWSLWLLDAYPVLVQSMKRQLRLCSRCCNHYTQMMCYREVGAFLLLRLIKNSPHVVCVTGKGASASVQWQQSCHSRSSFSIIGGIHCSALTVLYTWNNVLILHIILPKHSLQIHKKQYFTRVCTTYAHLSSLRCHLNFSQTLLVFWGHSNRHKLWANHIQFLHVSSLNAVV